MTMQNLNQLLKTISMLSDGQFHTEEKMATALKVPRATVSQYIQALRTLDIDVTEIPNRGYKLTQTLSLLDEKKVAQQCTIFNSRQLFLVPIVDSTNQFLLDRVNELDSGAVCVAEYQYNGRGRRGRHWFSPFGTNIYFSLYWRFHRSALTSTLTKLSLAVGVVVARLLSQLSKKVIKIKWPNDLYLDDKKLGGILIEMVGDGTDDLHVIIGVGINLSMSIPDGETMIDQAWIALGNFDRNRLVAQLIESLSRLMMEVECGGLIDFIDQWHQFDYCINKSVRLMVGDKVLTGLYRGINEQGAVLLEQDNEIKSYVGSDVSLRVNS